MSGNRRRQSLLNCETMFCLMTTFFYQLMAVTSLEPDSATSGSLLLLLQEKLDSTNSFLLLCHLKCQERSCLNLCRGLNEDESGKSGKRVRAKRNVATENNQPPSLSSINALSTIVSHRDTEDGLFEGSDVVTSDSRERGTDKGRDHHHHLPHQAEQAVATDEPFETSTARTTNLRAISDVSVTIGDNEDGELFADIEFRLRSGPEDPSSNRTIQLHMGSNTCNYDRRFPFCKEPNYLISSKLSAATNRVNKYSLTGLLFNALYWIELTVLEQEGVDADDDDDEAVTYRFTTPGCAKTRKDRSDRIYRCVKGLGRFPTTEPPQQSLMVEVVCIDYDRSGDGGGGGGEGDGGGGGVVSVDLRWSVDRPEGHWVTSILVRQLPDENLVMTRQTERQEIKLYLAVNSVYEILASATQANRMNIVYHGLILNTSEALLKGRSEQPGCASGALSDNSHGVLLGVLVCLSLVIAVVVFFVHRKCKNYRQGISGNTNYKSSPSSQPLNPIDEWEIDPREVVLGAEIGRGAFGRVLVGYYRDTKVAIKIMKDNIPDLHRDNLLREISLMKGVGFHPNIVTMLGACTVREPVALIVEYMPFGNLQSFLKKCRIDREIEDLERRNDVLYCLLDETTGVKESWQITSNDILSFARQVALAMQYLTDRRYVHRDLAARNVLLGSGKVVKVCDFGLARLVYSGDQYFKLTSGRLPLRWMAIESIRDSVFTTYSDVWSFGVLLWEMVTLGASPYPDVALVDLYRLLSEGYRMQQPANCSDELYEIMSQCWRDRIADRPNFSDIRSRLEDLLAQSVDYLDLDNIDVCLDHSQNTDNDYSASNDRPLVSRDDAAFIC